MKKALIIILCGLGFSGLFGQSGTNFRSPLDIPLVLSGNFGELRSDHFHSGIDIKTQGHIGQKVHAVEEGYVSRIKIQPGGYGKALYIAHPNGYTSVYGHLSRYNTVIEKYAKDIQYAKESHSVDIYLKKGTLAVSKGELIAFSGNTGSSAGPHLHFEIRTTADQHPQNVLSYNFPIEDNIPPKISKLVLYPINRHSNVASSSDKKIYTPYLKEQTYSVNNSEVINVYGEIGFGIEVHDYLNGARNKCGIFSLELKLDDERIYYSEMDEFSFGNSRFINAHIDYEAKANKGLSVQKLYKLPYDNLKIYKQLKNSGRIHISDTLNHHVVIEAVDSYGNASILQFRIQGKDADTMPELKEDDKGMPLPYNSSSIFSASGVKLSFPAYCVYEDSRFNFVRTKGNDGLLSDIYHLGSEDIPVHKSFSFELDFEPSKEYSEEKICIVAIDEQEEQSFAGGVFAEGRVRVDLRRFGTYAVSVDTIPPVILPVNFKSGSDLSAKKSIRLKVSDDLSGIASYEGYIDNRWVLMEYDPKNELLQYVFDEKVQKTGGNHEFELYLADLKGNKVVFHTVFYR